MTKFVSFFILMITPGLAQAAFSDVAPSHPNAQAIAYVKSAGIVHGNPDGTYRPDQAINRAAFTKIVMGAKSDEVQIESCLTQNSISFVDITTSDWFAKYVCQAVYDLIISGYADNTFRPGNTINMAEAAKILALSYNLPLGTGGEWYEPYLDALNALNALPPSYLGPSQLVSRGDMAEMIYRLDSPADTPVPAPTADSPSPEPSTGQYTAFTDTVIGNGQTSVLFFYAAWCPKCQKNNQLLEDWYQTQSFPVSVYKIDYDTASELKSRYGVVQQDTFIKIDGAGNPVATVTFPSEQKLTELISQ